MRRLPETAAELRRHVRRKFHRAAARASETKSGGIIPTAAKAGRWFRSRIFAKSLISEKKIRECQRPHASASGAVRISRYFVFGSPNGPFRTWIGCAPVSGIRTGPSENLMTENTDRQSGREFARDILGPSEEIRACRQRGASASWAPALSSAAIRRAACGIVRDEQRAAARAPHMASSGCKGRKLCAAGELMN